eukprot:11181729-Lingulodinium_polyedra.AAC.1
MHVAQGPVAEIRKAGLCSERWRFRQMEARFPGDGGDQFGSWAADWDAPQAPFVDWLKDQA